MSSSIFKNATKEQKSTFLSLSVGYITLFCPITLTLPFFPPEAGRHGVSSGIVGLIFGMVYLIPVLISPLVGLLITRIGPKMVIMSGILLNGIFSIIFGLLENVKSKDWFVAESFICMGFSSVGVATVYTTTLTYITQLFPGNMSFVVGITEMYIAVAEIIALLSGSFLYELGGYKLPYIVFGTLHLLAIPLDLLLLPTDSSSQNNDTKPHSTVNLNDTMLIEDEPRATVNQCTAVRVNHQVGQEKINGKINANAEWIPTQATNPIKNEEKISGTLRLWHLVLIPRTMLMAVVNLCTGISWSFLRSTLEPHLSPLELTPTQISLVFLLISVMSGISSVFWGWFVKKIEKTWIVISGGMLVIGITFCFLGPVPFLGLQTSLWLIIACLVILTFALNGTRIPATEATVLYTLEAGHNDNIDTYAIVSSLIATMYCAGAVIGASSGGLLLEFLGYENSAGIYGCIMFLWGAFLLSYFILFHNKGISQQQISGHPTKTNKSEQCDELARKKSLKSEIVLPR